MTLKTKKLCKRIVAGVCVTVMSLIGILPGFGTLTINAEPEHTLWVVGDSTVSAFNDSYYIPRYGYGTQLGDYVDDTYAVENLALSGRSSKSFINEANYKKLTDGIKSGDVLVVGFGHNDEKADDVERFTSGNGDYTTEGSFAKSLYDNYVKLAQSKGAEVILCTPIVRRTADGNWSESQLHKTANGDYAASVIKLGQDVGVPVVDLTTSTKELYDRLTPAGTKDLHSWQSKSENSIDNTHLNKYGAKYVAYLFAKAAKEFNTSFSSHITLTAGEPDKTKVEYINKDYVELDYDNNLQQSTIFDDYVVGDVHFKGTAFGQLGGNPSVNNHKLGTDEDGNMIVGVLGNKGKIATGEDGIVMYYYKVPKDSQFKLMAKATVNSFDAHGQVAFGLMARDDMYIDKYASGINSDYVVAGTLGTGCNCFYRKDGALGGKAALTTESLVEGGSYNLSIVSNSDGYTCTFGNEPAQSGGYDFALTKVDSDYVYIGMFAARNASVTYNNIYLEVDGQVVVNTKKSEYTVTVDKEGEGSVTSNKSSANEGEEVALTVKPESGYIFKEWKVLAGNITITDNKFVMPKENVSVVAVFEKLRKEWDFSKDDSIRGTNGIKLQSKPAASFNGLIIDTTSGKFDSTGTNGWAQVNNGTVIKVPVEGPSVISVEFYTKEYSVNGEAATDKKQSFTYKGKEKYITIQTTANTYVKSITVMDFVEAGEYKYPNDYEIKGVKYNNFDNSGNSHGISAGSNASIVLNLADKANITIITCRYTSGVNAVVESSSGKVTKTEIDEAGAPGLQHVIIGVEAGVAELKVSSSTFVHSILIEYTPELKDRKFDVWDFGAKLETDTNKFNNIITPEAWIQSGVISKGSFSKGATTSFGDLSLTHNSGDRLYTNAEELKDYNAGTYAYAQKEFADGYKALGAYYCNGTGGASRRYVQISNVQAGDKIIAYVGISQKANSQFIFEGIGGATGQKEIVDVAVGEFVKCEFVAEKTGTYKIWENATGKPMYHRIVRVPGVKVTGTLNMGEYSGTNHTLKFTNKTTGKQTVAELAGNTFSVTLAPGYEYSASLSGASGWGISNETKTVTIADEEVFTGKNNVTLNVVPKVLYTYSGEIKGFESGYDLSKLSIKLVADPSANLDPVNINIESDMSFSASLEPDIEYSLVLEGVNDYEIVSSTVISKNSNFVEDISVAAKKTYNVSGKFLGVDASKVSNLVFVNVADNYTYTAIIEDGYRVKLRTGEYLAVATCEGASTKTHVVVKTEDVSRDLMFVSTGSPAAKEWVSDIYVGYARNANNYSTVREAIAACEAMNPTDESKRITVHIAPGTYREQVIINTPYISLVNDSDKEVLLTWYYGIGYKYYSADSSGYYNPENAYDSYGKNIASRWGAAVYVKSGATGFRASGITFENSFNRYITDEEIADGVEVSGTEAIKIERKYGLDVTSKAATERAAALAIEADKAEFVNCKFYGSQDTLFTGNANTHMYFKNCLIEGQTDYIFGDGNVVFDTCELSFKGYSANSAAGYITAARPDTATKGYLFRNCVVTANDKLTVTPGFFGRPWGANAKVVFFNTKLADKSLIDAKGWMDMSGNQPQNANLIEFNTTALDGSSINTSNRVGKVLTAEQANAIKLTDYFEGWTPVSYAESSTNVEFKTNPFITDNGDLNTPYPGHTLTVGYAINDSNDASIIKWYRVKDGREVLVHSSTATAGKTYKITKEDIGAQIKVEVLPLNADNVAGTAKTAVVAEVVRDGYEDPSATGPGAILGEGVNIYLAGDSTVKDYSASGIWSGGTARDEGAWGEYLQAFFNKDFVTIVNYANGGRSSRNFINEGSLNKIAASIKKGDYLFIQFGHNDCANGTGYLADRYVPLGTPDANGIYPTTPGRLVPTPAELDNKGYGSECYTYDCGGTYKWYLLQYIEVAKKAGAIPVLVTPVSRLYYDANGKIKPHHDSTDTTTGTYVSSNDAYVEAVKQLAEEQDVLLIDAFDLTKRLFEEAYNAAGNDSYGKQIMHPGDKTHNNKLGGLMEAAVIADTIQKMGLDISFAVQAPNRVLGETTTGKKVFFINAEGKMEAYDNETEYGTRAIYWETLGQSMFKSIDDKAKELANEGGNSGGENEGGNSGGENEGGNSGGENEGGNSSGENEGGNSGGDNKGGNADDNNESIATGDSRNVYIISLLAILSLACIFVTGKKKKA